MAPKVGGREHERAATTSKSLTTFCSDQVLPDVDVARPVASRGLLLELSMRAFPDTLMIKKENA